MNFFNTNFNFSKIPFTQAGLLEYRSNRPRVDKKGSTIKIIGIDSINIIKFFNKTVDTTRLCNNMFEVSPYTLSFEDFFIPDVFILFNKASVHKKVPLAFQRIMNKYANLLKENTYLKNTENVFPNRLNINLLKDFNLTPTDYQLNFLNFYNKEISKLELNGAILSAAPGTGKTFTSLAWAHCLNATRIIVIAPLNSLNTPWREAVIGNEAAKVKSYFKEPQTYWVSNEKRILNEERIIICNYEKLEYLLEISNRLKLTKKIAIILDESHNMNESDSKQTQLFVKLCKELECKDVLFMSGTPIKALGSELNTLFSVVDNRYNLEASKRFKKIYTAAGKGALSILADRFSKISFRVEKSELNLDKPNICRVKVKIPDSKKYTIDSIKKQMIEFINERTLYYEKRRKDDEKTYFSLVNKYKETIKNDIKQYRELEVYQNYATAIKQAGRFELRKMGDQLKYCNSFENNKIMSVLSKDEKIIFKEVKTLYKYTILKIQGECLGRVLGKIREECFRDIASNIDYQSFIATSEKKVLIYGSYISSCEAAFDKIQSLNYNALRIYGEHTKNLNKNIGEFTSNPDANPLITTFDSLSTAVPLTMANSMLLINVPFRDYMYQQTIARIWRKGTDTPVFIYEFELDTDEELNISTRSIDILKITAEIAESITGMASGLGETLEYKDGGSVVNLEDFGITTYIEQAVNRDVINW